MNLERYADVWSGYWLCKLGGMTGCCVQDSTEMPMPTESVGEVLRKTCSVKEDVWGAHKRRRGAAHPERYKRRERQIVRREVVDSVSLSRTGEGDSQL